MGHYYGEMMCPDCGEIHCVCPETLERERKWARMSWEEQQEEKMKTLREVWRLVDEENKRRKKTKTKNKLKS